jgi:hypothetical protein
LRIFLFDRMSRTPHGKRSASRTSTPLALRVARGIEAVSMSKQDLARENESPRNRNTELVVERAALSLRNTESRLSRLSGPGVIGTLIDDDRRLVTEASS